MQKSYIAGLQEGYIHGLQGSGEKGCCIFPLFILVGQFQSDHKPVRIEIWKYQRQQQAFRINTTHDINHTS